VFQSGCGAEEFLRRSLRWRGSFLQPRRNHYGSLHRSGPRRALGLRANTAGVFSGARGEVVPVRFSDRLSECGAAYQPVKAISSPWFQRSRKEKARPCAGPWHPPLLGIRVGCTYCETVRDFPVNAAVTQAFRFSQDELEKRPRSSRERTEISVIRLAEMACVADLGASKPLLGVLQASERVLCLGEESWPFLGK
jgi:hypothetical protein